jgi:RNA polymerase sigma factor (sigma-70 family)
VNDQSDSQLLRAYAEQSHEPAFTELVRRHVDFVHSAARRMVCDSHLAQDVTQGVFVALAKQAPQLVGQPVLSGWLHRTAQNIAAQTVRTDVRRRAREQEAFAMNELLATEPNAVWENIAPHLDTALGELSEPDRDALLLRYFERKSAQEMAQILGISDEAAQKRVSRAVERLRELFSKRNVSIGASGLAVLISANAVQAAPVGLAATISAAAVLAGKTISTSTIIAATKTIAMTTLQKTFIAAALTAAIGTGIFEAHQNSELRDQVQMLQQQQTPLTEQLAQWQREHDDATNQLAGLRAENAQLKSNSNENELFKLRGEVTRLKNAASERENDLNEAGLAEVAARINQTKKWLEQTPTEQIPELDFLNVSHWVNYTSAHLGWQGTTNNFEFILGNLRTAAKKQFAIILGEGLDDYLVANGGRLPSDLSELKPYLANQNYSAISSGIQLSEINDAVLQRYQLLHTGNVNDLTQSEPLILEKSPIQNAQYDALFKIGAFGFSYTGVSPIGSSGSGPISPPNNTKLQSLFKTQ